MLVLSRMNGEEIIIGASVSPVTIQVVEIRGNKVRLGVHAPPETYVHRAETARAIARERGEVGLRSPAPKPEDAA